MRMQSKGLGRDSFIKRADGGQLLCISIGCLRVSYGRLTELINFPGVHVCLRRGSIEVVDK